jgi:acetyltransferase-like isoleucine patch superfamily enzyme
MSRARQMLSGKSHGLIHNLYSRIYFRVKYIYLKTYNYFKRNKSIVLVGDAKIGMHHSALLSLDNSKIIVHDGTFKVGIDFGYFDGSIYDPRKDTCRIFLTNSTLEIYGNVSLHPGVAINAENAKVVIRNNTIINGGTSIISKKKIEIGENCLFAQGVIIRDNDGHKLYSGTDSVDSEIQETIIGNHCWLGQRAMILKGVILQDNVVVAAGAVVSKSVNANSVVAGVPAKVIKENVSWKA